MDAAVRICHISYSKTQFQIYDSVKYFQKELVKSETNRRLTRLRAHYNNDVWEKRKEPPEDWNKPLPDYLQKEYENTYLNLKSKELNGEPIPVVADTLTSDKCVIM